MERNIEEGGSTLILKPLALTYHFGQATSTPARRRTAKITRHRPQPAVKRNIVDSDGTDNVISDANFGDCLGVHSKKRDGVDRTRREARETQSLREVGGSSYKN